MVSFRMILGVNDESTNTKLYNMNSELYEAPDADACIRVLSPVPKRTVTEEIPLLLLNAESAPINEALPEITE